jgi:hypothetical protein
MLTMDELHIILTAYEMRIEHDKPTNKEATFKASNKTKIEEYKMSDSSDNELNEEESNFFKKLERGSGKHKGKLPFICFNYVKVGHFVAKCPYKNKNNEEYSKGYRKGKTEKKINFFGTKEESI